MMHCACCAEDMHLHDGHLEGGVLIASIGAPWLGALCTYHLEDNGT